MVLMILILVLVLRPVNLQMLFSWWKAALVYI